MPNRIASIHAFKRETASKLRFLGLTSFLGLASAGHALSQDTDREPAPASTTAQDPNPQKQANPETAEGGTNEARGALETATTPEQQAKITALIEQLGEPKFSQRENASSQLLQIGVPALQSLRKQLQVTTDQDTKSRISELVDRLVDGQIEIKIEDFLAMKDVNFEGWAEIKHILKEDSIPIRKLFINLVQDHPAVPESMQRRLTTRDRSIALEKVIAKVQETQNRRFPTNADAFALLLPLTDPNVKMPSACEPLVFRVLQCKTGTDLRKNTRLFPPYSMLLDIWMRQTSVENREVVFFYGMDWNLREASRLLAHDTIVNHKDVSVDALAASLQAMARFGNQSDLLAISTLLSDPRSVTGASFTAQGRIKNQLGDLAIASIACILGVDLEDVGFKGVKRDPKRGFLIAEIGFPEKAPEKRAAALKMVKAILDTIPTPPPRFGQ
jgi:hypothetical protein